MKTGWRGPCPYKPTKPIRLTCPLRAADLTGSGPHAAIACFQGFPLCQRHHPTKEDLPFAGWRRLEAKPLTSLHPANGKELWALMVIQRVFLVLVLKTKIHWICRVRQKFHRREQYCRILLLSCLSEIIHNQSKRKRKWQRAKKTLRYFSLRSFAVLSSIKPNRFPGKE